MKYDVLVVGGGPAGSAAAAAAVEEGASVLIIEKRRKVGLPVQCAEYIPAPLLRDTNLTEAGVVQEVKGMKTFFPGGRVQEYNARGYMLDRGTFDQRLWTKAMVLGAVGMTSATLVNLKGESAVLSAGGAETTVEATVVVGADGPRSTVGYLSGVMNARFVHAAQMTVPLTEPLEHTEVYFRKRYTGGYGWLFPKGDVANVGIGISQEPRSSEAKPLRMLLEMFAETLALDGKVGKKVLSKTGGLIPVGGPLKTVIDNVVLAGDAAGHTHAITGGGVPQAIACGKMAGEAAARAAMAGDLYLLEDYEREWKELLGDELLRAVDRRAEMEARWGELDDILPRCWMTFPEYYK